MADEDTKLHALRIQQAPKLDGKPDDDCWKTAKSIELQYQFEPKPGDKPTERTEVKIVYDNAAVYLLALCYDKHLDSIQHILTSRGTVWGNTECVYIFLDTYHDGQNAFGFGVSIDNVQDDFKATDGGRNIDGSWDAVWESKTGLIENGWVAEIKIPYSAIRFPKKDIQDWVCDFTREILRKKELIGWCTTPPTTPAFVPFLRIIDGVEKIVPPLRLSLSPYASGYYLTQGNATSQSFHGGADIKYGINESFTLDMTLIPDFGQVVSDQKVKNLTPYEVQYQERRPFFLEGSELFSKNDLFYSRRIGDLSDFNSYRHNDSGYVANNPPEQTQLLNAFKISGKTKGNLAIGLFNAVTDNLRVDATNTQNNVKEILYEPLTNFNILVLDQTLKNNSHLGFINTNVTRTAKGNDANVTGLDLKLLNKANTYQFSLQENNSNIFVKNGGDIKSAEVVSGNRINTGFAKITGMWQWGYGANVVSNTYNTNDMGYLAKNNFIHHNAYLRQFITKPFWHFLNMNSGLFLDYETQYEGNKFAYVQVGARNKVDWKNYMTMVTYFWANPTVQKDYYEPRSSGWHFNIPRQYQTGIYFSPDYRKTLAIDCGLNYKWLDEKNRYVLDFNFAPRLKLSNKFLLVYNYYNAYSSNNYGYVGNDGSNIYFGRRDVKEISNSFYLSYVFTNKMSLSLNARHYWSGGRYDQYYTLQNDGDLQATNQNLSADFDYNAWTMDAVFSMQFAPGSYLTLAWKNLADYDGVLPKFAYADNWNTTFNQQLANSFSIKMLYYLDVNNWRRKA